MSSDLLKRIAEIEGWGADAGGFFWTPSGWWIDDVKDIPWSTCGPLIEKYSIAIGFQWKIPGGPEIDFWEVWLILENLTGEAKDPDLKTAIVKAVVAAHE